VQKVGLCHLQNRIYFKHCTLQYFGLLRSTRIMKYILMKQNFTAFETIKRGWGISNGGDVSKSTKLPSMQIAVAALI
jgi:hypothetical protein